MSGKSVSATELFAFLGPRRAQPWEEQLALVEQLNIAVGGEDLRKNP